MRRVAVLSCMILAGFMSAALGVFIVGAMNAAFGQSAERQFHVVLPETSWNTIGKHVAKAPYEEVAPILGAISQQIAQQVRDDAQARQNALSEVDRLKGELAKKPPAAPAPPEAKPE